MGKKALRVVIAVLAAALVMNIVGCGNKGQSPAENEFHIGSAYNTLKILRDSEYEDLGRELNISMAKGETEGAQLLVTPKYDVTAYKVEVSDLVGADDAKIAKENVKVFVQKYLEVKSKTTNQNNMDYLPGYYPDMLLPVEIAVEYGENIIGAGQNQGFTIEVKTTSETVAGDYSGTVTLELDGKTETVPLNVTVWDIDVTKSYGQTAISWWPDATMTGEIASNTEIYTNYYESLLDDYRTCLTKVPGSYRPDTMAASVLKYWSHPDFTSFCIPGDFTTSGQFNSGRFIDYLYELAQLSEPGKILVSKGYVYNIDEPSLSQRDKINKVREAIYWCEDEVLLRLESEGYFDKFDAQYKSDFEKAVTSIPIVIPVASTAIISALGESINTYCAVIDQLDTERYRELYKEAAEKTADRGGTTWYYTCVQPLWPYPSFHIDDALIGNRIMRWMQKSYDLDGFLYWALGSFYHLSGTWLWTDPYADPIRFLSNNGDGYLVYPGAKYGQNTFFGSLRLTTLRDSQEDLNMLYELDNLLREHADFYGLDENYFDMNDLVQELYDELFTGTRYEKSDVNFYAQRERLAEIILALNGGAKLVYKTTHSGTGASIELYTANGYTIEVDGTAVTPVATSGQGNKYVISRELTNRITLNVTVKKDGEVVETQSILLGEKTAKLDLTSDNITVTQSSVMTAEQSGLQVKFVSRGDTVIEKTSFNPALTLPESLFTSSYKNIGDMMFTVTNTETTDVTAFIRLQSGSRRVSLKENIIIPAGETITFTVRNIGANDIIATGAVNIQLCLANVDADNELLPDRTLVINDVIFTVTE